jgi:Zn-finger nucleic acid-binding protein
MNEEVYLNVTLDVCPTCAGIWFDDNELRDLMAQDADAPRKLEERYVPEVQTVPAVATPRRCPADGMPLQPYRYLYHSPIVLDACSECGGFWVQDGELMKMQQYLDSTRGETEPEAPPEPARARRIQDFFGLLRDSLTPWRKS